MLRSSTFAEILKLFFSFLKNKLNIYVFVLLYVVAMLRPLQPLVEYAVNYDYISKVLCINKDKPEMSCNGKCQLMKKMEKQQDEDYKSIRILIEEYPIGFVELINVDTKADFSESVNSLIFSRQKNYTSQFLGATFHPPAV